MRPIAPFVAAVLLAIAALARAGDAPAPNRPATDPPPKIEAPALLGLVGSWDVTTKGPKDESKGTATWSLGVAGTALIEEIHTEGSMSFYALGVYRVGADGKTLKCWWYDSMGAGQVWPFQGSLVEGGYDLEGDMMGSTMKLSMRKVGEGNELVMKIGDKVVATVKSTKAAKPVELPAPTEGVAKCPFVAAETGAWDVKGSMMGSAYTGSASIRPAVGGTLALLDYSAKTMMGEHVGFGVAAVEPDGSKMKMWMFTNLFFAPVVLEGSLTATTWEGEGTSPRGPVKKKLVKTDAGFEMTTWLNGMEMGKETHTRKK